MKWMILILGVVSNASASVLIKMAMGCQDTPIQISKPLSIIGNLPLMSGMVLYITAFVLYAVSLTYLPLNIAHPVLTSGSIALVFMASVLFFGETVSIVNFLGVVLIVCGVAALTVN